MRRMVCVCAELVQRHTTLSQNWTNVLWGIKINILNEIHFLLLTMSLLDVSLWMISHVCILNTWYERQRILVNNHPKRRPKDVHLTMCSLKKLRYHSTLSHCWASVGDAGPASKQRWDLWIQKMWQLNYSPRQWPCLFCNDRRKQMTRVYLIITWGRNTEWFNILTTQGNEWSKNVYM